LLIYFIFRGQITYEQFMCT